MKRPAFSRNQRVGLTHLSLALALLLAACASTDEQAEDAAMTSALKSEVKEKILDEGEAALAAGQISSARDNFGRALALDPKNVRARLGLAEVNLANLEAYQALAIFDDLANDPDTAAQALQGKGIALAMMRNSGEATKSLTEALHMDPSLWRAWNALGQIYDTQHDWDKAQKSYESALKLNPHSEIVYNNVGVSLLMQKKYDDAVYAFHQALKLRRDFKVARSNLRLALAWQGKYDEALAGASRNERPIVLNNLGYVAILRRDFGVAESLLSQAMAESPSYFETAVQNLQYLRATQANGGAAKEGGLAR